jgi:hypothetical protein
MWEKLKDISAMAILPGIVLYFLGFICVEAYLARFGINSFDFVNTKFIVAGIFPAICLGISLLSALYVTSRILSDHLFSLPKWRERYLFYVSTLPAMLLVAIALQQILKAGEFVASSVSASGPTTHRPLILPLPEPLGTILMDGIFFFLFFLFLALIGLIIGLIIVAARKVSGRSARVPPVPAPQPASPSTNPRNSVAQMTGPATNVYLARAVIIGDLFFGCMLMSLLVWSWQQLRDEAFNFQSFREPQDVTLGIMFAWLTITITVFSVEVLLAQRIPGTPFAPGFATDFIKRIQDPQVLYGTFTGFILPLVAAVFLFGAPIYPRIPFSMGGGEPRQVVLKMKSPDAGFDCKTFFLIGESNQFFFVVEPKTDKTPGRALQVSKDQVGYVQTRVGVEGDVPFGDQPPPPGPVECYRIRTYYSGQSNVKFTVFMNDIQVGDYSSGGVTFDITRFIKPGPNKVRIAWTVDPKMAYLGDLAELIIEVKQGTEWSPLIARGVTALDTKAGEITSTIQGLVEK